MDLGVRGTPVPADVPGPHDPPLLGAAEDRVPRIESYDKDFKPMSLGTMRLPGGRGSLTLKALRIPGREAPEISAVALTRR